MAAKQSDKPPANLPKAVRIGAMDYEVHPWKAALATSNKALGECDPVNLIIRIREDMVPLKKAEVLIHEIFHGMWDTAALYNGQLDEEHVVSALAYQFLQVWRDNPALGKFLDAAFESSVIKAAA